MSFPSERIEDYLLSKASHERRLTEVAYANAKIGDVELVIISKDRRLFQNGEVSEEEIGRQLAREGLIRMPPWPRRTRNKFKPIDVEGKPISETIIEERR